MHMACTRMRLARLPFPDTVHRSTCARTGLPPLPKTLTSTFGPLAAPPVGTRKPPHFHCRLLLGRVHLGSPQRPITVSTATAMAPPHLGIGTDAGIRMRQQELVWAQCSRWFLRTCLWHLTGACCKLAHVVLPVACEPNNRYTNTQSRLALRAMVFQTDIPTPAMTWEGPGRS
jgi:hypothetical protein